METYAETFSDVYGGATLTWRVGWRWVGLRMETEVLKREWRFSALYPAATLFRGVL